MIKQHPLRNLIRAAQKELAEICDHYANLLGEMELPSYYTVALQRQQLRLMAENISETIELRSVDYIRQAISETIAALEKKTRMVLGVDTLVLEVRIEDQLRKRFVDLTLDQRFKALAVMVNQNLLLIHAQVLSEAIAPEDAEDSLRGVFNLRRTYQSALGRANRLVVSEILRAYHYTVQEFARWTDAQYISVTIDSDKWDDDAYRELAEGSPYEPDELPDYPRPLANYLLELTY